MKFVYLLKTVDGKYKIGIVKNPNKRVKQLQTGSSDNIVLSEIYQTKNANKIEKTLHNIYLHARINREWFSLSIDDEVDFTRKCKIIDDNITKLRDLGNRYI